MRTFVMGDPQVWFAHVQQVLAHHQLLNEAGNIVDDAQLISVGDHFDYGMDDTRAVAAEGLAIVRWLTAQPCGRGTVLLGNHGYPTRWSGRVGYPCRGDQP